MKTSHVLSGVSLFKILFSAFKRPGYKFEINFYPTLIKNCEDTLL